MSKRRRDPLVVTIPDPLTAFVKNPELIGKNAEKLAKLCEEHPELLGLEPLPEYDGHLGPLDQDVREMHHGRMEAEIVKLRAAIRRDRDTTGHALCWYRPELWEVLPEKVEPKPKVPPRKEFLAGCGIFHDSLVKSKRVKPPT